MILNTKNGKYMEVWQSWHHPEHSGKQSKLLRADSTPPPFLGLKGLAVLKSFYSFSDKQAKLKINLLLLKGDFVGIPLSL